ncbi:MAG: hypothetical protein SRB2_02771 [Desulfobacteraceae bacterium Eth-SRB2]|nr:MAG: hypothetical protein SRB2_02771 [Desulfobacteraceae bacterium Eth-SRB2]
MHTNGKKTTSADLSAIIEGLIKADVKFIFARTLSGRMEPELRSQ